MKTPLRTVLKNFLNHVEDLEARSKLCDDQYEIEFQELKKLTDKLKEDPEYSCSCALRDINRPKNRYKDIVPYDFSRVVLPKYEGIPGSDYINSSYVKGASGAFAYIAAQGPLPNTVIDFWRMIWICDVQVVVMACNEQEAGKHKCESYWPVKGDSKHFGNISVELIKTSQVCPDFLVRTLLVKCDTQVRDVYQFHYTTWPDHGVPDTVQPILELVRLMRDCQASETVPILVHCSAGCGRTGTICAVDFVWACLRQGKLDEDFSLFHIAMELRSQRIAMIQTKEQYMLAHKAVASMFEQQLKVIDCHTYENVDEDGEPLLWKELHKDKITSDRQKSVEKNFPERYLGCSASSFNSIEKSKCETISENESKHSENSDVSKDVPIASSRPNQLSNLNLRNGNVCEPLAAINNNCKQVSCSESIISNKNSDSSFSRNSILSEQSNEESIPFIDDDDVSIRPQGGRAYLNIPSCDSISKLMNSFDPFVDKLSLGTDDSSPDSENLPITIQCKPTDVEIGGRFSNRSSLPATNVEESVYGKNERSSSFNKTVVSSPTEAVETSIVKSQPVVSFKKLDPDDEKLQNDPSPDCGSKTKENNEIKSAKKAGKVTVMRRPSISKLKALFERSSGSSDRSSTDGVKRSLFRHHTHHVSRAGSAPPSLNCMDKNAAVEKESVLMMVTRKFRSSSVKTEEEMHTKQKDGPQNKKPATSSFIHFKESINSLSRTMSFNLNKTLKSYSPSKAKTETAHSSLSSNPVTYSRTNENVLVGNNKPKLPDPALKPKLPDPALKPKLPDPALKPKLLDSSFKPKLPDPSLKPKLFDVPLKGKSMWYDKTSLHRAVAIVKPIENRADYVNVPNTAVSKNTGKSCASIFSCIDKPPKILPFFGSLNKSDAKDPSAMWYENNENSVMDNKLSVDPKVEASSETEKHNSKGHFSKVLPFMQTIVSPKKNTSQTENAEGSMSRETTSENEPEIALCNSKFYTYVKSQPVLPLKKKVLEPPACPVPDEIIPINVSLMKNDVDDTSSFWPRNSLTPSEESSTESVKSISYIKDPKVMPNSNETKVRTSSVSSEDGKKYKLVDNESIFPPAIPKKMFIGKHKGSDPQNIVLEETVSLKSKESNMKVSSDEVVLDKKTDAAAECSDTTGDLPEEKDVYINVNVSAKKNLEQIENSLRNNPRGAIIDLTSRQSYSMEDELVKAVKDLTASTSVKATTSLKPANAKHPGYEYIWPETKYEHPNKSKSNSENSNQVLLSKHSKTGLCYSPPLRRNVNTSFAVTKSQSCLNLDWMEMDRNNSAAESTLEQSSEPTKKLVNEAVVELNTLLNQLTTRTLAEDVNTSSSNISVAKHTKSMQVQASDTSQNTQKFKVENIKQENIAVESKPLFTKSYISVATSKDEEIIFHFPPPPRLPPPPEDDPPSETFDIICKNGALLVTGGDKTKRKDDIKSTKFDERPDLTVKSNCSSSVQTETTHDLPKPLPRKTKMAGLRRSASYTMIPQPEVKNLGYENVSLEKYQTLSQFEINKSKLSDNKNTVSQINLPLKTESKNKSQEYNAMYSTPKQKLFKTKTNKQPDYVNVNGQLLPIFGSQPETNNNSSKRDFKNIIPNTSDKQKITVGSSLSRTTNTHVENDDKRVDHIQKSATMPKLNNLANNENIIVSNYEYQGGQSISYIKGDKVASKKFTVAEDDSQMYSPYGKIIRLPETNAVTSTNVSKDNSLVDSVHNESASTPESLKKKLLPSKKSERAPMPPKILQIELDESNFVKMDTKNDISPRKLPSRKQEKAPPPPSLLQKSSSSKNVHLGAFDKSHQFINSSQNPKKLPALYENRSDVQNSAKGPVRQQMETASNRGNNGHGLQHSQSDVSLFRALKERKMQSIHSFQKMTNLKPLPLNKKPNESKQDLALSSSDSDSITSKSSKESSNLLLKDRTKELSVEPLPVETSKEHQAFASSHGTTTECPSVPLFNASSSEQSEMPLLKENFKRSIPVAPPRSKRRSTMEIQYAKVKSHDDSPVTLAAAKLKQEDSESSSKRLPTSELPPAIPTKTKEAYEVPEVVGKKENKNKYLDNRRNSADASMKAFKTKL